MELDPDSSDGTGSAPVRDNGLPAELIRGHLPLILGIFSTLFIAIRILSAAYYDPETAYAILQAGGAGSVILGAALSSVGIFCLAVSAVAFERYFFALPGSLILKNFWLAAAIVTGVASIFTAPGYIILSLAVIIGGYFLVAYVLHPVVRRLLGYSYEDDRKAIRDALMTQDPNLISQVFKDPQKRQSSIRRSERFAYIVTAIAVAFSAVSISPWMPAAQISLKNSSSVIGYIVSYSPSEMTVLLVQDRRVVYIGSPSVVAIKICDAGGSPPPIPEFFSSHSRYPACKFH